MIHQLCCLALTLSSCLPKDKGGPCTCLSRPCVSCLVGHVCRNRISFSPLLILPSLSFSLPSLSSSTILTSGNLSLSLCPPCHPLEHKEECRGYLRGLSPVSNISYNCLLLSVTSHVRSVLASLFLKTPSQRHRLWPVLAPTFLITCSLSLSSTHLDPDHHFLGICLP